MTVDAEVGAVSVVVPVYNERERFAEFAPALVAFVRRQEPGSELVFVDDGSDDETPALIDEVIAAHPTTPIRSLLRDHAGKGAAVSAGLASACAPIACFCDLDLATPLEELDRIITVARDSKGLVIGSRDLAGSTLVEHEGRLREFLGRAYNRLLQATITPGIMDTQCGAKAATVAVWNALLPFCHEDGYAWDAEAIAVARALGVGVREIPISWRHDHRSKVNVLRDGMSMVMATGRVWRSARRAKASTSAPTEQSASGEVFDDANAKLLQASDSDHWWFRGKAALVSTALRRVVSRLPARAWLLDVDAGSGGVSSMLGWDPERLVVVDGSQTLVRTANTRHGLRAIQASVSQLPVADAAIDVVCMLDVVEHLEDPVRAMREAKRVLAPTGWVIVNVPAHRWLWSAADEELGHLRRYTRASLRDELAAAGFSPVVLTHVFSWLVVPVWLRRRVVSSGAPELGLDRSSWLIDRVAMALTALERALIGRVTLPFGTSVLCVAQSARERGGLTRAPE